MYHKNELTNEISLDAGGRSRVSMLTTLFDGKILNADNPFIYENVGNGTGVFQTNKFQMSVTPGQYFIRRSPRITPYFSGKPQFVEVTFDTFGIQAGVTKISGYFSSSPISPYSTEYDGFWLENNGTTITLEIRRFGVVVASIPMSSWDNYEAVVGYNWNNFTVIIFDYLWLGGAIFRFFLKTDQGFVLIHSFHYAGNQSDTITSSPNHSVRHEIRSTGGSGSFRQICAQVATEGSFIEQGKSLSMINTTAVAAGTVGVIYAIKGVKKTALHRNIAVEVTNIGSASTTSSDNGLLMMIINPTLSAALTYVTNSAVSEGTPATSITVTPGSGRIIHTVPSGTTGSGFGLNDSILSDIGMSIANVSDEYVLAYMPTTNNQSIFGILTVKES